ncbi:co-chaperone DjlA [Yersinia massiliensis]|uniref:Co-chaperone protein DjlA n=1 Tax=Yersinia massiliensis TaxID=419257 RepID=A0AA91BHY4_9GAMM|nr:MULTISPECIES: co-chaperone DjlA [Yersinia]MDA5546801.1 co-chaperone DjlA [Yersinia massiliensis]NIL26766.1 co-chaperone DjlA [Yersinia massiliensis]OWF74240.1 molecular chaperone DjlA [Yersinia frederiksenii]PHZ23380.1 co-chaperone DjlA [Yersinia massiliensis]UZM78462.1 co-chaperone DjlA [Yersinia massiliensis]
MQYWGKLLGLVLGLMSGTGFWGVVLGLLVGHMVDRVRSTKRRGYFADQQTRQVIFFRATFQVMGHLTKAKGRVTEVDIQLASQLMDRMQLHGEARTAAQQAFREGKESGFPLRERLQELRSVCFGRFDLIRMFLEIQLQAAFADGSLHPNERQVLYVIAEELGISRGQFDQFLSMIEGGRQFGGHGGQHGGYSRGGYQQASNGPTMEDACKVLGVNSSDDSVVIKRAYRKLMGEHHPDKLVAKGLPPEMMEMAKQKAQEIQAAYDLIKREKGFK